MDIYDHKKAFIEFQLRLLQHSIQPPTTLRNRQIPPEHDISDHALTSAIYKLNVATRRHERVIHSTQAVRHVAEQIDELYRDNGTDGAEGGGEMDVSVRELMDADVVQGLPDEWPLESGTQEETERLQEAYSTHIATLTSLTSALTSLRQKHAHYLQLHLQLQAFSSPKENVQPNLVTRDGAVAKELERMRVLTAKVQAVVKGKEERLREIMKEMEASTGAAVGDAWEGVDVMKYIQDYFVSALPAIAVEEDVDPDDEVG